MRQRLARLVVSGVGAMVLLAGCRDADHGEHAHRTDRAQTLLAEYQNDPLTRPVEIGLAASEAPVVEAEVDTIDDVPPEGRSGRDDLHFAYWFDVPEGSDRDTLLDLAAVDLVDRGWQLVVSTDELRMLTVGSGTHDLRTTIVMSDPESGYLVQEVRVEH